MGVEFAGDILIAPLSEEIDGFIKMFFVDDTGVVGAGDEEDGYVGILHGPALFAVGSVHEFKQSFKTIEGEDEAVALVGVVSGKDGGIADDPGVRIAFVLEAFGIFGEGEAIDEMAAVFFTFE